MPSKPQETNAERVCEKCGTWVYWDNGDVTYHCHCHAGWVWRTPAPQEAAGVDLPYIERLMPACGADSVMRIIAHMVDIEDGFYVRYEDHANQLRECMAKLAQAELGMKLWMARYEKREAEVDVLNNRVAELEAKLAREVQG